ncbi:MAG: acetyl-CoA hydrolase/transferase C-terminal domain-containing protein [Dehalococcoidia bacterium]|nr:acetyl-CoA hydrolase/transferase C-terminal domain-containing protein [Dehalococcoidia bacterium]
MSARNWREEYQKKLISAEEAAGKIKSGDRVVFTAGRESFAIGMALAGRLGDVKDVEVHVPSPGYDFGWYDEGWDESFKLSIGIPTGISQEAMDAHRVDFQFGMLYPFQENPTERPPDILLTEISPPDNNGFCSFGASLWNKRQHVRQARTVIAEVNANLIRTYGDNFVHVSEIDYFVEHLSTGGAPGTGSLAGRELKKPDPFLKDIAGYVNSVINDRDTIQIGVGRTTEPLVRLGLLDGKNDLGYHSEATPSGIISLVRDGVINCRYKTVNPDKAIVTSLGGGTKDEMEWAAGNPMFHLVDVALLEDIRIISAHDNMVAINNALAIDLTGQIAAETLGTRQLSVAGGQIPFVFGALLSKGGRSVTVLPSTAQDGTVSRIMSTLPEGTVVTIQRNCTDYVVTEYGIARLFGKTIRQRAQELISIAHPDFRAELTKAARSLYWP